MSLNQTKFGLGRDKLCHLHLLQAILTLKLCDLGNSRSSHITHILKILKQNIDR